MCLCVYVSACMCQCECVYACVFGCLCECVCVCVFECVCEKERRDAETEIKGNDNRRVTTGIKKMAFTPSHSLFLSHTSISLTLSLTLHKSHPRPMLYYSEQANLKLELKKKYREVQRKEEKQRGKREKTERVTEM